MKYLKQIALVITLVVCAVLFPQPQEADTEWEWVGYTGRSVERAGWITPTGYKGKYEAKDNQGVITLHGSRNEASRHLQAKIREGR